MYIWFGRSGTVLQVQVHQGEMSGHKDGNLVNSCNWFLWHIRLYHSSLSLSNCFLIRLYAVIFSLQLLLYRLCSTIGSVDDNVRHARTHTHPHNHEHAYCLPTPNPCRGQVSVNCFPCSRWMDHSIRGGKEKKKKDTHTHTSMKM